ncbi:MULTISPECIES: sodium:solute symporter family transporter [unclassified Streptomyces]|uniref:sodium:solute symporter family transporter n=1 Tax=unclassified Streptomyces TaxID=2593676 RepID=UPI002E12791D|nr:hypothetical protein OG384_35470 [Streptomyces sp. NBC_01324]
MVHVVPVRAEVHEEAAIRLAADGSADGMTIALTVSMFFLTSLTVVAALTLSSAASLAHDIFAGRDGHDRRATGEMRTLRWSAVAVGAPAVVLAVALEGREVTFLAQFAITAAAAAVLPGADFAWFPLESTGLVSVPVGFLTGWAASRTTGSGPRSRAQYWALEERALTESGSAEPPGRVR